MSDFENLTWPQLRALWTLIKAGQTDPTGRVFEDLVLGCFAISGAAVERPYPVKLDGAIIEQIDGMVSVKHLSCLIETKHRSSNVNIEPIAKLRNQLMRRPSGVIGSVFVSSDFTDPAITLAKYLAPQAILLWNGAEIDWLIERKASFVDALMRKYNRLAKTGYPDYDVSEDQVQ